MKYDQFYNKKRVLITLLIIYCFFFTVCCKSGNDLCLYLNIASNFQGTRDSHQMLLVSNIQRSQCTMWADLSSTPCRDLCMVCKYALLYLRNSQQLDMQLNCKLCHRGSCLKHTLGIVCLEVQCRLSICCRMGNRQSQCCCHSSWLDRLWDSTQFSRSRLQWARDNLHCKYKFHYKVCILSYRSLCIFRHFHMIYIQGHTNHMFVKRNF